MKVKRLPGGMASAPNTVFYAIICFHSFNGEFISEARSKKI